MVLAAIFVLEWGVKFSKRSAVFDKLRADGIAENNNEYNNIV